VTHIKQHKYFHHLKGLGYNNFNKDCVLYPWPIEVVKIFWLFYMCPFAMGLTHCYKTTVIFAFILIVSAWKTAQHISK